MTVRCQLSLFVPVAQAEALERVRRVVDPVQQALIPAHVTLAREDELAGTTPERIGERLAASRPAALVLRFGRPERFGGHGILVRATEGLVAFRDLRTVLLGPPSPREHEPHLTLAHPRNPEAPGNDLGAAGELAGKRLLFDEVRWIEQDSGTPWRTRATWNLVPAR